MPQGENTTNLDRLDGQQKYLDVQPSRLIGVQSEEHVDLRLDISDLGSAYIQMIFSRLDLGWIHGADRGLECGTGS